MKSQTLFFFKYFLRENDSVQFWNVQSIKKFYDIEWADLISMAQIWFEQRILITVLWLNSEGDWDWVRKISPDLWTWIFFKYLSPFLSFIYYQFLQHLTWILGLKPSAGGTLKAMPASEAPNVVRIKSYINCFVKIESFKVVPCGECTP